MTHSVLSPVRLDVFFIDGTCINVKIINHLCNVSVTVTLPLRTETVIYIVHVFFNLKQLHLMMSFQIPTVVLVSSLFSLRQLIKN